MKQTPFTGGRRSRPVPVVADEQQSEAPADDTALASAATHPPPLLTRRTIFVAVALFVVTLLFLMSLQSTLGLSVTGLSKEPYFNDQAESWLHGRWDVDASPTSADIETINGKSYSYYPPFPALLLLPLVALFGVGASDILFTTVLSAVNISLLFLLLEQVRVNGWSPRKWSEHALITVFCFFGTINLYLSLGGTVWF